MDNMQFKLVTLGDKYWFTIIQGIGTLKFKIKKKIKLYTLCFALGSIGIEIIFDFLLPHMSIDNFDGTQQL